MLTNQAFENRGNFIGLWLHHAKQLSQAAEVVWNSHIQEYQLEDGSVGKIHQLAAPAKLLMGLSLESLIKGLIIHKDNDLFKDGRVSREISHHILKDLFTKAGITLTDPVEIRFLERMTECVLWSAKYATPIRAGQYNPNLHTTRDDDFDTFMKLYNQVLNEIGLS